MVLSCERVYLTPFWFKIIHFITNRGISRNLRILLMEFPTFVRAVTTEHRRIHISGFMKNIHRMTVIFWKGKCKPRYVLCMLNFNKFDIFDALIFGNNAPSGI